jgi:hypothetical protein
MTEPTSRERPPAAPRRRGLGGLFVRSGRRGPGRSARVGPLRALRLRRRGRRDGAVGVPALPDRPGPLTTAARAELRDRFFLDVGVIWDAYFTARGKRQVRMGGLRADLARAQAGMATAQATIRDVGPTPTADTVQASPGELARGRSSELVLRRRTQRYARETAAARAGLETAQATVDRLRTELARLMAEDDHDRYRSAVREHNAMARFSTERSIYDGALIRRHPDGAELAERLDRRPPPFTPWADEALGPVRS